MLYLLLAASRQREGVINGPIQPSGVRVMTNIKLFRAPSLNNLTGKRRELAPAITIVESNIAILILCIIFSGGY